MDCAALSVVNYDHPLLSFDDNVCVPGHCGGDDAMSC